MEPTGEAGITINCDLWPEDDGWKGQVFHGMKTSLVKQSKKQ